MAELGLPVWFDGKKYIIFYDGKSKEYPIGGLACEYSRFKPYTLKDIIMKCPVFNQTSASRENREEAVKWFFDELFDKYDPVTAVMIFTDMGALIRDSLWPDEETENDMADEIDGEIISDKIKEYILEDSGLEDFNTDTIGALLLSAYSYFALSYAAFYRCFEMLANGGGEEEDVNRFMMFYSKNMEFQHIEYKLVLLEGKFAEMFTIKSSLSLILFETAHVLDNQTPIVKCKNCGHYFVPTGRSDSIYCTYPSPQDSEKTCKEIGAQVRRSNKEKTDITTREYRKVYMRYKMLIRRHPEETNYKEQFNKLKNEVKEWRNKLEHGQTTPEEFLDWLKQFSKGGGAIESSDSKI